MCLGISFEFSLSSSGPRVCLFTYFAFGIAVFDIYGMWYLCICRVQATRFQAVRVCHVRTSMENLLLGLSTTSIWGLLTPFNPVPPLSSPSSSPVEAETSCILQRHKSPLPSANVNHREGILRENVVVCLLIPSFPWLEERHRWSTISAVFLRQKSF